MLKGIYAQKYNQLPPRLHNLLELAKRVEMELDDSKARLFRHLSDYYVESRYGMESKDLPCTLEASSQILEEVEETLQWLHAQI